MTTPEPEKRPDVDVRALGKKFQEETGVHYSEFPFSFALYCYSAAYSLQQEKLDELNLKLGAAELFVGKAKDLEKENKELREALDHTFIKTGLQDSEINDIRQRFNLDEEVKNEQG